MEKNNDSVFEVYTFFYDGDTGPVTLFQSKSILGIYDITSCYPNSRELAISEFGLWESTSFHLSQDLVRYDLNSQTVHSLQIEQHPILYQDDRYPLIRNLIWSHELNPTEDEYFICWLFARSKQELEQLERIRKHNEEHLPGMKQLVK